MIKKIQYLFELYGWVSFYKLHYLFLEIFNKLYFGNVQIKRNSFFSFNLFFFKCV